MHSLFRIIITVAGSLLAATLFATASQAASPTFSCATARINDAERTICQTNYLARLDQRMGELYYSVRGQLSPWSRNRIQRIQLAWLRHRNACGDARWCIERTYRKRLRQLARYEYCFDDTASPGCISRRLRRGVQRWEWRRIVEH